MQFAPLHVARSETAACGLGAVIDLAGRASSDTVARARHVLNRLDHRGASGSDPETGDGAGILVQVPDAFLRRAARQQLGLELPAPGDYAVGMVFLPRDDALRLRCEELFVRLCAEESHRALGWRDVPVCSDRIGGDARSTEPVCRQVFVERRSGDDDSFARKLSVIRRRVEKEAAAAGVPMADFSVVSLSQRTLVYKGLLRARQLAGYYPDLTDPSFASALALVHSRFSTNTLGTWDLAHPFGLLCHNGEINTIRANLAWLAAREPQLRCASLGGDLQKLFPIAEQGWSDSAILDAMVELLVLGGRSLPHALAMLIPPAWTDPSLDLPDDVRSFYEYHAALVEPWDGPAAVLASDGIRVCALLDRNGLRPCRYTVSRDNIVVFASEAGVADIDPADIVEAGRVEPGRMLVADTETGRLVRDAEVKRVLARRRPYQRWLTAEKVFLSDQPTRSVEALDTDTRTTLLRAFGYTREDLRLLLAPMALDGREAVGSMGDDAPLAALSVRPKLLAAYFKQQFAQVTNPAIDPEREALVMSLRTTVGAIGNLLDESPQHCRRVAMPTPILTSDELERLRHLDQHRFATATLPILYPVAGGADGLAAAVDALCRQASRLVWDGTTILVLSDRGVDAATAPISPLLATAAVHAHLVREGARTMCGLIVESGEPREPMHLALLIGYGAAAVNPYLALDAVRDLAASGDVRDLTPDQAEANYITALAKALLKVCSKMGISSIQSYRGAQAFEAIGLGRRMVERYFTGTVSRVGGLELPDLHDEVAERHTAAFASTDAAALDDGGEYAWRLGSEHHAWTPQVITHLQRAVRDDDAVAFGAYADAIDQSRRLVTLRGLLELVAADQPIDISEVEPAETIMHRFSTGAMSLGSLSPEAHETLAVAMNSLGGRSNTGEGGEDAARSRRAADGTLRRSAIKQIASGRFGVTTAYLVDADQLQIKVAQGAKPGEGGQLPGTKVDALIARLRHSTPGVGLISPPPHHDVYSIEDLAQLIHDLKSVNPAAEISVKLVAEAGVGTIAAGVAKAKAEHIVIAGHDGGTGASPWASIKHAGLPWELGLAETHQVLVANRLRDRVALQVDGGLRTGRDVVIAALLGAEEFGFATAPLVALGCVMMRVCHLNTCPVGVATQDAQLRSRYTGLPVHVERFMRFVAEQVRAIMALLGVRRVDELVGRTDLLRQPVATRWPWLRDLDLTPILARVPGDTGRRRRAQNHDLEAAADQRWLARAEAACRGQRSVIEDTVANTDTSVGVQLAGAIARRCPDGLDDDTLVLRLTGTAGQSLAAFAPRGLTIHVIGAANDYVAKGLAGGRVIIHPDPRSPIVPEESIVIGNVALYGATAGQLFVRGRAGERFAVRNSGAQAVVEGIGDHGCEYMTGGVVVVLGSVGRNFAAGMSGGVAFLLDTGCLERNVNPASVSLCPVTDDADAEVFFDLVRRHHQATLSSAAKRALADPARTLTRVRKVLPNDLARVLASRSQAAAV